jgi:hypothetical protein
LRNDKTIAASPNGMKSPMLPLWSKDPAIERTTAGARLRNGVRGVRKRKLLAAASYSGGRRVPPCGNGRRGIRDVLVKEILRELELGNSVAENDLALGKYFVETEVFRRLVRGEVDIVSGDKGTGKTALYKILLERRSEFDELARVELVPGFNPAGSPVFQRLAEGSVLEEGQYASIWKAYFLSLVGNWVLEVFEGGFTESMQALDRLLTSLDLRSSDDSPSAVFSSVVNLVRRLANPSRAELAIAMTPAGMPIVLPKVEFEDPGPPPRPRLVPHEHAFAVLERVLIEEDLHVWVLMDRLDEAFQGFPKAEIPALRALLRTYLDLKPFEHLNLKLFLRRDLFRRITTGGFVNLTHVNASRVDIEWDEEDLFDLLYRRLSESRRFIELLAAGSDRAQVFAAVFVDKVDPGSRKPQTWPWMLSRVRDGNGIRPPRNLIDLVKKAHDAQLRHEARGDSEFIAGQPVIGSDALKRGLEALSKERVEDTLLAEAGDYAPIIERFRGGKTEFNEESLARQLDIPRDEVPATTKILRELGFLEPFGTTFKIPMLYRDGLALTQGKAFGSADSAPGDE